MLKDHHIRSNDILSSLRLGDCEDDPTCIQHRSMDGTNNDNSNDNTTTDNPTTPSYNNNSNNNQNNSVQNEINISTPTLTSNRKSILHNTTEQSGSKRIFLFSKRALSENAPDPEPCILSPQNLNIPTEPDPSPIFHNSNNAAYSTSSSTNGNNADFDATNNNINKAPSTPLHQALSIYERRFMLHLCQGRAYADAADLRLTSCRSCIQEQAVMVRALRAAVSNLSDHWNNATRSRIDFTSVYLQKMEDNGKLLNNFENVLKGLSKIELDKELKAIARVNGRVMETLLDTVPVERMRSWANQCQTGYTNLQILFSELEQSFDELNQLYHRDEDGKVDLYAEQQLAELEREVEVNIVALRDNEANRLTKLTEDHKEVVKVILNAMKDEGSAQASFTTLESMSKASSHLIPSMQSDDNVLKEIMLKVSNAKTDAMKRMKLRLRQISVAQNRLHKVQTFAGTQGTLRDTLNQHSEDMSHLEHLVELPISYQDFLSEIRRRRAYGEAVASSATAMMERLATMRNDEVRAREKFVRGPGRHLMPSFYEIFVPTLATPPPLFTPQLPSTIEMDTLPNVSLDEESSTAIQGFVNETSDVKMSVGGGESSLTDTSSDLRDDKMSDIHGSLSKLSINKGKTMNDKAESGIVSIDEHSRNDVIMDAESRMDDDVKAEFDAEQKTLVYENAVLRQAIERMGGKKPREYIDQARLKDLGSKQETDEKVAQLQNELEKMKNELSLSESNNEKATKTLSLIKKKALTNIASKQMKQDDSKLCDKISHSRFGVGDVALFMPTGIGSEGKRTYVAFHSNCPHRFLSTDSIEGKPDYVLGRIVYQEELIAGSLGTDTNPHNLMDGTKFWILTVEVIKLGRGKGDSI